MKDLAKVNRQLPVWYGLKGVERKFATLFGVEHYMIDNGLSSAPMQAFQKINCEWVEVKHQCTGKIYVLNH